MKLLHLADLHLGRLFHDQSLIEDQRYMLNQVLDIAARDRYAAILLSGDIYDRSIPSAEAVTLFSEFLHSLHSRFPSLAICIIAGNHDSPDRLAFGHELFRTMNIHIVSDPNRSFEPVIVQDGLERCAVFLLPFLYPGSLEGSEPETGHNHGVLKGGKLVPTPDPHIGGDTPERWGLRTQQELAAEAARRLKERRTALEAEGITRSVLVAHLFTKEGMETESERIFVGTAEQIDARLFSGFSYVALGHLHRFQQVAPNAWYAGSPLAYSFGEADHSKVCVAVDVQGSPVRTADFPDTGGDRGAAGGHDAAAVSVQAIPLEPLHPVRRIKAKFADLMGAFGPDTGDFDLRSAYLEIELTDDQLVENAQRLLQQRYPLVLSVKQDRAFQALQQERAAMQGNLHDLAAGNGGRSRNTLDDFSAFEQALYGSIDQDKLNLFTTLLEQCNHETP